MDGVTVLSRRATIIELLAASVFATCGGGIARAGSSHQKLVLILLRGGLDSVAAVPPYGDPEYTRVRGSLALPRPEMQDGLLQLNDLFGLHPSLKLVHDLYLSGDLAIIPAVASQYRGNSHDEAIRVLETGSHSSDAGSGWLGRTANCLKPYMNLQVLINSDKHPIVLEGSPLPIATQREDVRLKAARVEFLAGFDKALQCGIFDIRELASSWGLPINGNEECLSQWASREAASLSQQTAFAFAAQMESWDGPSVGVIESVGWDTHRDQGTTSGKLAILLDGLARTLTELRIQLARSWHNTTIVVVSEFGRDVWANSYDGTNHGVGGVALVAGGNVNGGRILGSWPGLPHSTEQRSLLPTTDVRSIFKAVLRRSFSLSNELIEECIFPDSPNIPALDHLFRT